MSGAGGAALPMFFWAFPPVALPPTPRRDRARQGRLGVQWPQEKALALKPTWYFAIDGGIRRSSRASPRRRGCQR